jgi:hypothetical protein
VWTDSIVVGALVGALAASSITHPGDAVAVGAEHPGNVKNIFEVIH